MYYLKLIKLLFKTYQSGWPVLQTDLEGFLFGSISCSVCATAKLCKTPNTKNNIQRIDIVIVMLLQQGKQRTVIPTTC